MSGDLYEYLSESHKEEFEKTADPIHVWRLIRSLGTWAPYPEWVTKYLSGVAEDLLDIERAGKGFPAEVVACLGIKIKGQSIQMTTRFTQ